MKEELYQWIKNLGVFYILFTAVLHLVPDKKYERFVRFFMGILLIFMMCTPLFALFGKTSELMESFSYHYGLEDDLREQKELENLQALYLQRGMELETEEKIRQIFKNQGINLLDVAVHIEGERVTAGILISEELSEEQERGIEDALLETCGIREGDVSVTIASHGQDAVDHSAASGSVSGTSGHAGVKKE